MIDRAPDWTRKDAVRIIAKLYGMTVSSRPLPSERDQNFLILSQDGEKFVLKIANVLEKKQVLEFQNAVMEHLNRSRCGEICPRIVPNLSGDKISTARDSLGEEHFVRLVRFIEGVPLAHVHPQTPDLLFDFGRFIGRLVPMFRDLKEQRFQEGLIWNMQNGPATIRAFKGHIPEVRRRRLIGHFLSQFEDLAAPLLPSLSKGLIHNDANDYNVIVSRPDLSPGNFGKRRVAGIIDFGDMTYSYILSELAVALAYVMLKKENPLRAASSVVAGYHSELPMKDRELQALFPLVLLRLCMSVSISAYQKKRRPENDYLTVSENDAWDTLERLQAVHPNLAACTFREACGKAAHPESNRFVRWVRKSRTRFFPVIKGTLSPEKRAVLDLSPGSPLFQDAAFLSERRVFASIISGELAGKGVRIGIGRYAEPRLIQTHDETAVGGQKPHREGVVHLGMDIFAGPGTPMCVPLQGTVHLVQNKRKDKTKGSLTVILEHRADNGKIVFYTLYRHLSRKSLAALSPGRTVRRGERVGKIAETVENGGWPPHLHFQVILDPLSLGLDFPGTALYPERQVWLGLCPDPNLILNVKGIGRKEKPLTVEETLKLRQTHVGKSLSISYHKPLKIVRGFMQYLFDDTGRQYLDAVNNVPNVGHSHPRVVRAAAQQMAVLNTNTRYLHDNLVRYAQRLCARMPWPLRVCFIVNSGSEANDLALRLARHYTGQKDIIVVDNAYHGNLTSLIEISSYKFNGPGGSGRPPLTHVVSMPDLYQGRFRYGDRQAGKKYAEEVWSAVEEVQGEGRNIAAFICESLPGCGGQIVLPEGYLKHAYRYVRKAGGVCIADEVQVGFARVGTHFWGFATQGVVPDIVTLGKPIGDGHPLGAVVTTPEIADAFANGMEYFNTYGGNPVSSAVGLAVLDVIEEERLQENALQVGQYLKSRLKKLQKKYPLIGDVRGLGLFLGIELVKDRETQVPAPEPTAYVVERMKEEGVLISLDGPNRNVLKVKPPLIFTRRDADRLVNALDRILAEDPLRIS
ncbi:MAG: aminotransferase class III-fold pyridoxal phosphate-dependent enzyme [Candidatus Aminicenantales bacterium]